MKIAARAGKGRAIEDSVRFVNYKGFFWALLFDKTQFMIEQRLKIHFHYFMNHKIMQFNFKFYQIIINFTFGDIGYTSLITSYFFLFKFFVFCFLDYLNFFGRYGILG